MDLLEKSRTQRELFTVAHAGLASQAASDRMGAEARCELRLDGASHEGKALLETDELLFRGDARGRAIRAASASRFRSRRFAV